MFGKKIVKFLVFQLKTLVTRSKLVELWGLGQNLLKFVSFYVKNCQNFVFLGQIYLQGQTFVIRSKFHIMQKKIEFKVIINQLIIANYVHTEGVTSRYDNIHVNIIITNSFIQ